MRPLPLLAIAFAVSAAASAQDFTGVCRASSSYDLSVTPDALRFDRAGPAPRRIELHDGRLVVDGAAVRVSREDGDRLRLFEHDLRALVPRVKAVAREGVDLAAAALRAEAARLDLDADTQGELDGQLATHTAALKRRIDASTSTHDWQGEALERQQAAIVADLAPLLVADLGRQALAAALEGDLAAAARLRDGAATLTGDLRPRLERRMQALRPKVAALCPSIDHLYELQRGVRGANGRLLDLLDSGGATSAP